jgi:hypothetical protein
MSRLGIDVELQLANIRGKLKDLRESSRAPSLRAWRQHLLELTGCDFGPNTIRRQESGESSLDAEYVLAVHAATGVHLGYLLLDEDLPAPAAAEPDRRAKIQLPAGVASALEATVEELFTEESGRVRRAS